VDHRLFLPPLPGPGTFDHTPEVPFLPPMWDAIYHEYQPTLALNLLHSTDWLASRGGPLPDPLFLELALYSHMVDFVTGSNPLSFLVATEGETGAIPGFGEMLFQVDSQGGLLPTDPLGTGLTLTRRLQDLQRARQESTGGPWLLRGRMERPLQPVRITTAYHPLSYLVFVAAHPEAPFLSYPRNIYDPALYTLFPALATYHSLWSAPADPDHRDARLLVLVNWTGQPADYALRFDPEECFGPGHGGVKLFAIDLASGARTPVGGDLTDTTILDFGGHHAGGGDTTSLPQVPARGVLLYEIR
jgi:hypothetical protein